MEFYDEDKPRFVFQSRPSSSRRKTDDEEEEDHKAPSKIFISISVETWSNGEDIALLNALKAFPKEAAMRWEKVAAAVPGKKSKAACMKRVTELKKGFRSSKSGAN
ncbi:hypothetical protein IGI04_025184 [Brassica rapa subsp. trilocularis]|uniref:Myb-like domain-containing protein n=1 Tax=Brassica rapa subsp. trilocularis TaxID=1813537 RepID=A0ABQ7M8V9_BRACM|nr:hypothetical protein IGI04_025184 [Brassica rapa subsp. trilocularis]